MSNAVVIPDAPEATGALQDFSIHPSWWSFIHLLGGAVMAFYFAFFVQFQLPADIGAPWVHAWLPFLLLLVGAYFLLIAIIKRYSWSYSLRAERLISREGIIARRESGIRLRDVRSVELRQSINDRLMSTGTVLFASAASDNADVIWKGIDDPGKMRDLVQQRIDALRDDVRPASRKHNAFPSG